MSSQSFLLVFINLNIRLITSIPWRNNFVVGQGSTIDKECQINISFSIRECIVIAVLTVVGGKDEARHHI